MENLHSHENGFDQANDSPVTISSLYRKDFPNAFIVHGFHYDFEEHENGYVSKNPLRQPDDLRPIRGCCVVGNDLPILLKDLPNEDLQKHWNDWIPWFQPADIRDFATTDITQSKIISPDSFKTIPDHQHAVNPDLHHHLHDKATVPKTGSPCPKYMSRDNYKLPCMIKTTHGMGCTGTYKVTTKEQAEKILQELENLYECPDPVFTEIIDDITLNVGAQIHLFGNGEFYWLGVTHQRITGSSKFRWAGGYSNWDEHEHFRDVLFKTLKPAIDYIHEKGYIGIVEILAELDRRKSKIIEQKIN